MTVAELLEHLADVNPAAEVRIEFAGDDYRNVCVDSVAYEYGVVSTVWIGAES